MAPDTLSDKPTPEALEVSAISSIVPDVIGINSMFTSSSLLLIIAEALGDFDSTSESFKLQNFSKVFPNFSCIYIQTANHNLYSNVDILQCGVFTLCFKFFYVYKQITDAIDATVDFVVDDNIIGEVEEGTVVEVRAVDENAVGGSSSEEALHDVHDVKVDEDLSDREVVPLEESQSLGNSTSDEPYVGQEFESEAAAHAFYNTYATRVGFIIRVSKLSRSRRDGSAIGRALVCNKEGFRMPDKREKIVRQRAETRVGCRAMILVRKVNSGKWVVTKFVKEHTHPLSPGKGRRDLIYDQYPNEHDKIRELSQQLAAEKKRSATYKRHLEMIFEHIEEHNQSLSKKIQDIVHNVREMESRDQHHHR
ncbi:uncharacterized protein [Nicotiana sylvestris]|uniref:uncharacterized protein n=1 Tax=Nicotiana sylvestris TaxID=4096 RepID=UPI00388C7E32